MRKQEEMVAELHHLVAQSDALIEDLPADDGVSLRDVEVVSHTVQKDKLRRGQTARPPL